MKNNISNNKEQYEEYYDVKDKQEEQKSIVVYNDDVNTFDWVIKSLIDVCDHTDIQAEQCAYMVHHKGKCGVKSGSYDELEPKCLALLNRQISAKIE